MSEEKKNLRRKTNNNFLFITLFFLIGIVFLNMFLFRGSRSEYEIVDQTINYYINEDGSVTRNTIVYLETNDEKSFNYLLENFMTPDDEKEVHYIDLLKTLSDNTQKELKLLSFSSEVSHDYPYIEVDETVVIDGYIIFKNDKNNAEFSLPNQKINIDSKTILNVNYPDNWELLNSNPTPNRMERKKVFWTNVGKIDFPEIIFEIRP